MRKKILTLVLVVTLMFTTLAPTALAADETIKDRLYYQEMLEVLVEVIEQLGLYYEEGADLLLETLSDYIALYPIYSASLTVEEDTVVVDMLADFFLESPEQFPIFANVMYENQDRYSHYMEAVVYEQSYVMNESYVGIGVEFDSEMLNGLQIINVFSGSPAEEAGMRIGDIIVGVDGTDVTEMHYSQVSPMIRGEEGTKLEITVRRDNSYVTMTITRKQIVISNISFEDLGDGVAYIRITRFGDIATFTDFIELYNNLPYDGYRAVVYDLRDNLGGSVDTLLNILNYSMWEKNAEAFTMASRAYGDETYYSLGAGWQPNGVYILVNENSASAAEMFTLSMQSLGAVVIGTATYGKGVGQSHIPFSDGSTAVITDFAIYGPEGVSYNEAGVTPDIYLPTGFAPLYRERDLYVGDEGEDVFGLEQRLKAMGYMEEMPDLTFTDATLEAVYAYERERSIPTRGCATINTMLSIIRAARAFDSYYLEEDLALNAALVLATEDAKEPLSFELTPRTFEEWDEWYGEDN